MPPQDLRDRLVVQLVRRPSILPPSLAEVFSPLFENPGTVCLGKDEDEWPDRNGEEELHPEDPQALEVSEYDSASSERVRKGPLTPRVYLRR